MENWSLLVSVVGLVITVLGLIAGGTWLVGEVKAETRVLNATVTSLVNATVRLDAAIEKIFIHLNKNTNDLTDHKVRINILEKKQ